MDGIGQLEGVSVFCVAHRSRRASKQTVMRGLDESSLEQALANQPAYPAFKIWYECSDQIEGAAAFAHKRAPQWQGE